MSKNVIITKYADKACSFLIQDNRLLSVNVLNTADRIGSVYVGKIKNILHNIQACFVEIANREICFLPFSEMQNPICINRPLSGMPSQGDDILVQLTKEASKNKQASVSCNISYTGNYFVFTTGNTTLGISSKLNKQQKEQIKNVFTNQLMLDNDGKLLLDHSETSIPPYGLIVRTQTVNLLDKSEADFRNAFETEKTNFYSIIQKAAHASCFQCIYTPNLPYESLLTHYGIHEYDEVVTDLNEAYTALQGISKPLRQYKDTNLSLCKLYSLETKISEALGKIVWMKSGANLVIESTECLTTIDVNSAKSIKGKISEESIIQINTEAAKEAALQIRLRNLSGIIIIDFINMNDTNAENKLLEYMKSLVAKDSTATTVIDITPLGLMELTRKKVCKPLSEELRG